MTAKQLPARPDLEQYRKQAKDLLKSFQAGDPDALSRIRQSHPRFKKTGSPIQGSFFKLSDAQWVIAREYGVRELAEVRRSSPPPRRAGGHDFAAGNACLRDRSRRQDG